MRNLSVELRPKTFDEVVGNSDAVRSIRNRLDSGNIPTAILLAGPSGVGKTTLAHIIARELESDDIREFNAADQTGVDEMRELVKGLQFRPLSGQYTVIILDECHKLTEPSQNCVLLPAEKDSPVIWIFCTTDPNKIIPALRKRCLSFTLYPLSPIDRVFLASRTLADKATPAFLSALEKSNIAAPRDVLMACEKFLAGTPVAQALLEPGTEHDPQYQEVARAVLSGNWTKTSSMLSDFKSTDARGLRGTIMSFLSNSLLKCDESDHADALARSVKDLMLYGSSFADGEVFSTVKAVSYEVCKRLKGAE